MERATKTSKQYETSKLKVPHIREKFSIELKNRFSILGDYEELELKEMWNHFKSAYNETASNILGQKKKNQEWISAESWKLVDERRTVKAKIVCTRSERMKKKFRQEYSEKDKSVKRSMKKDKRDWLDRSASDAETAANSGNMKGVYDIGGGGVGVI